MTLERSGQPLRREIPSEVKQKMLADVKLFERKVLPRLKSFMVSGGDSRQIVKRWASLKASVQMPEVSSYAFLKTEYYGPAYSLNALSPEENLLLSSQITYLKMALDTFIMAAKGERSLTEAEIKSFAVLFCERWPLYVVSLRRALVSPIVAEDLPREDIIASAIKPPRPPELSVPGDKPRPGLNPKKIIF